MFSIRAEALWHESEACIRIEFAGTRVHVPLRTFLDIRDWFVCRSDDFTEFFRRAGPQGPQPHEIPKGINGPVAPIEDCGCIVLGGPTGVHKVHWEGCRFTKKTYEAPKLTRIDESDPRVKEMMNSSPTPSVQPPR